MSYEHQRYLAERPDGHTLDGIPGDCYRTCLAVVVDLPRDEVPHFALFGSSCDDYTRRWVRDRFPGWDIGWYVPAWPPFENPEAIDPVLQRFVVATGPSPRGPFLHCVVIDSHSGDLVHDPHPSGAGRAGDIVCVDAIVPAYDPPPEEPVALPSRALAVT